jgi:uncharacterized damage-inducible protein DinB
MTARPSQDLWITKWEEINRKIAKLAGEFPEEHLDHRPAEHLRTFGEVLRHLAFWNQYVADVLRGRKADDSANEVSLAEYPTRARMIEVLGESSEAVVAALKDSEGDTKTIELLITFIEHSGEHYGQLAVYARLIGITPPASRGEA